MTKKKEIEKQPERGDKILQVVLIVSGPLSIWSRLVQILVYKLVAQLSTLYSTDDGNSRVVMKHFRPGIPALARGRAAVIPTDIVS